MTTPKPINADAMRAAFAELRARVDYLERALGVFVDERDLSDPKVAIEARGWPNAAAMKGKRFSQCPPDFLDHLAGALRSMSEREPKEGEKDFRQQNRKQAATARTWARRLRREAAAAARAQAAAEGEDDLQPL